jgi:hypothetical protein
MTRSSQPKVLAPAKRATTKTQMKPGLKGRKNEALSDEELEGGAIDGKQASGGRKNRKKTK